MRKMMSVFLAAGIGLISANAYAQDTDGRSVNFLIFMKTKPSTEFDPIMFGNFSQFIKAMDGSRLLLLSHSAKSIHGDVINLQQDVLKYGEGDKVSDVGINCQLAFAADKTVPSDVQYSLSGDCQIIDRFNGEAMTLKAHIPATDLPDAAKGTDVWMELYEDGKSGIAFYANVSKK